MLISFWFKNRFIFDDKLFPYARISQIEKIPIPNKVSTECKNQLIALVSQILTAKKQLQQAKTESDRNYLERKCETLDKQIDQLVYQLYGLSSFSTIAIDGSKFQSASSKKHSMKMDRLEKEGKLIVRKIEKLINILQENDKKEERDERIIKKLEAQKKKLEERKQKIEEAKKELAQRQKGIKDKENREKHQINIIEPDARMMKEINANGYNIQLSVDVESEIIVNVSVESDRSDNHQFSKQHQNTEKILGEDKQREYIADGGYISTETIDYIEEEKVEAYINDSRAIETIPDLEKLLERGKTIT